MVCWSRAPSRCSSLRWSRRYSACARTSSKLPRSSMANFMGVVCRASAHPAHRVALACTRRRGAGEREREREPEGGTLTRGTVQSDVAVVRLDDALADVQAEAQADAGAALHRGARDDGETLPDLLLRGHGYADALVVHRDTRQIAQVALLALPALAFPAVVFPAFPACPPFPGVPHHL